MLVESICLIAVLVVYYIIDEVIMKRKLPPGPMPLPIIGNLHLLSSKPYLDFHQLSLRHGPIYRLQVGSKLVIVINSYDHAREAFVSNGVAFSGRPYSLAAQLFSRGFKGVGFQGYTRQLKQQRKAIIQTMRSFQKDGRMEELVRDEIHQLVSNIEGHFHGTDATTILSPAALRKNVAVAINHIMASMTFGEDLKEKDKDNISRITSYLGVISDGLAITNITNAFSFMKYFPLHIINKYKEALRVRDMIFDEKFKTHQKLFNNNFPSLSNLANTLFQMQKKSSKNPEQSPADTLDNDHVEMTANDAIIAGTESPSSTVLFIIYFLMKFPDMQARIQKDLDDVTGRCRETEWSDRERLPYLEAFIYECMRCGSVMPLAVPHQTTADAGIGSFKVPRNTPVIVNVYGVHHDPKTWQHPMVFDPERFLNEDGNLNTSLASKVIVFGIGHRVCPGEILARMEAFLFTANLLQKYTFSHKGYMPSETDGKCGLVLRSPDIDVTIYKRQ